MTGRLTWIGGLAGVLGLGILWMIVAIERNRMLQLMPRTELRGVIEARAAAGAGALRPRATRGRAPLGEAVTESGTGAAADSLDSLEEALAAHRVILDAIFEDARVAELLRDEAGRAGMDPVARDRMTRDCSEALARMRGFWQDEVDRMPTGNPIVVAQGDLFFATLPDLPRLVEQGAARLRVSPVREQNGVRVPRASFRIDPTRADLAAEIATRDAIVEVTITESGAPRELLLALQQSYASLLADLGLTKPGGKR